MSNDEAYGKSLAGLICAAQDVLSHGRGVDRAQRCPMVMFRELASAIVLYAEVMVSVADRADPPKGDA